jgi:hypothetical protein
LGEFPASGKIADPSATIVEETKLTKTSLYRKVEGIDLRGRSSALCQAGFAVVSGTPSSCRNGAGTSVFNRQRTVIGFSPVHDSKS